MLSDNGVVSVMPHVVDSELNRDGLSPVCEGSDGFGSPVKGPPLSAVTWAVVLDSQSVLMSSDVLMPEEGFTSSHS